LLGFFIMKKILYLLIPILLFLNCKKEREKIELDFSPEMKAKLEASKQLILSKEKDTYQISNGSKTPNEAIQNFLTKAIQETNYNNNPFLFTEQEKLDVLYPNVYGSGTSLDVTPIEDYERLIDNLTRSGYEKTHSKMKSIHKNPRFEIRFQSPRQYKNIQGLKPKVVVYSNGKVLEFEEIKMVFKVGNLYKVGVLAP